MCWLLVTWLNETKFYTESSLYPEKVSHPDYAYKMNTSLKLALDFKCAIWPQQPSCFWLSNVQLLPNFMSDHAVGTDLKMRQFQISNKIEEYHEVTTQNK